MKNGNAYFNNSAATAEQKAKLNKSDLTQKEAVLEVLRIEGEPLTDAEIRQRAIQYKFVHGKTPITSIRRARSNLKKAGKVEATQQSRDGGYDVNTTCWRLKTKPPGQADFFGNPEPVPSNNGIYSGKGA